MIQNKFSIATINWLIKRWVCKLFAEAKVETIMQLHKSKLNNVLWGKLTFV